VRATATRGFTESDRRTLIDLLARVRRNIAGDAVDPTPRALAAAETINAAAAMAAK
jgi:hypothetical protein